MSDICLITYIGGKHYAKDFIVSTLDYSKTTYIELFGGSGKILFNKQKHTIEIYNDINYNLYSLFYTVKNYPNEFLNRIKYTLYCENIFRYYKDYIPTDIIDNAVKAFIIYNMSFSGMGNTYRYGFIKNFATQFINKLNGLSSLSNRLKDVEILNKDFREVLKSIETEEDIMLYADPPYYGTEHYYNGAGEYFGIEEHRILAEYLNNAKYSVAISYYYFDGIEELYPKNKWNYLSYEITNRVPKSYQHRTRKKELLLTNYQTGDIGLYD